MPLYAVDDVAPQLDEGAWAAPSADLIGDVRLGPRASVWFGAVIRAPIPIRHSSPIGMGARILNGAVIGRQCLVGAGALVTEGKTFEEGGLIVGVPARLVRTLTEAERSALRLSAAHYADKAAQYARSLKLQR